MLKLNVKKKNWQVWRILWLSVPWRIRDDESQDSWSCL